MLQTNLLPSRQVLKHIMRREKHYFAVILFSKLTDRQETNRKLWNIKDISKGQGWSSLNYHIASTGEWVPSAILTEGWTVNIFKKTNFCVIPVTWDEAPESNIQGFWERQYRLAYLKQMHELLKDYSERILAIKVHHTPLVSVQQWKIQE